jgi:hypothetical protein
LAGVGNSASAFRFAKGICTPGVFTPMVGLGGLVLGAAHKRSSEADQEVSRRAGGPPHKRLGVVRGKGRVFMIVGAMRASLPVE